MDHDELYLELAAEYVTQPEKEETVTTTDLVVEGELVPDVIDRSPGPITLFGTSDPRVALQRMADVATALVDVIDTRRLYVTINGRKHITVEGWTVLGGMCGIVPVVVDTRPNETGDGIVARVEAHRVADGMVVGAAEGECSRAESKWKNRDPFALRSMAQTRAISRALRAPLGQIVVLAGYDASAAEEMPVAEPEKQPEPQPEPRSKIPPEAQPTDEQRDEILALVRTLGRIDPQTDWAARCRQLAGVDWNMTTRTIAAMLIERLQAELRRLAGAEQAA